MLLTADVWARLRMRQFMFPGGATMPITKAGTAPGNWMVAAQ